MSRPTMTRFSFAGSIPTHRLDATPAILLCVLLLATIYQSAAAATFCETVPANQYRLVGCTLSLPSVEVIGTTITPWPRFGEGFGGYVFDVDDNNNGVWQPWQFTFSPGMGMALKCPQTNLCCFADPISAPALPLTNLDSYPHYWMVSCQSNQHAFFEDIVGRSPTDGTRLYQLNPGGYPLFDWTRGPPSPTNYSVYVYTNRAWSPAVPIAAIGEAVFVYQPAPFVYLPNILNPRFMAGTFAFDLETVYGKSVKIEFTEVLPPASWQELTNFVGNGHATTVVDPGSANLPAQRYYRARSTKP